MSKCEGCQFWYEVDKDVGQWACNDPVSWCNPHTGEEVCRFWQGAIQRESQPQNNSEAENTPTNTHIVQALREIAAEIDGVADAWQAMNLKGVATRARDWARKLRNVS